MKQKFIKKPTVVEAYQTNKEVIIQTWDGPKKASIGDWIVILRGEQYPYKPDVFERIFQPITPIE
nr:MAG TPA: PGDYG protein [Caudoviricetes sp.]